MVTTDFKNTTKQRVETKKLPDIDPPPAACCLPKRLLVCFAILTVLITLIVLSVILTLEKGYEEEPDDSYTDNYADGNDDQYTTDEDFTLSTKYNFTNHNFYSVRQWGGRPPLYRESVTTPIYYVIIAHTAGRFCTDLASCSAQLQVAQGLHVTNGQPTIGYNFAIGGDGNIYEGRGWFTRNSNRDHSLFIAFIGNFIYDELTMPMIDALVSLLEAGVIHEVLPETYKVVAHNQTAATLSPGQNVFRVIRTLPNFFPDVIPQSRT